MTAQKVIAGSARWDVHGGENEPWLAGLADKSVGVTLCDPPYSEHVHATGVRGVSRKTKAKSYTTTIDFDSLTDYSFVGELLRVTRRWVICFCALEQIGKYAEAAGASYIRSGVFRRGNATPQISGDRPAQSCEGIVILHPKGRKRWNGGGSHAYWSANRDPMERVHPTQKPLRLMLDLMGLFTEKDEIVCDPFLGSGTTGVAALRLGRRFIGCERKPMYESVARERMSAEDQGHSLAARRAGQLPLLGGA